MRQQNFVANKSKFNKFFVFEAKQVIWAKLMRRATA